MVQEPEARVEKIECWIRARDCARQPHSTSFVYRIDELTATDMRVALC